MIFKYACYTEMSEEATEYLAMLGYDCLFSARNGLGNLLLASQSGIAVGAISCNIPDDVIDCTNNPQLFQAVSAIRDGTDIMQYFTNGVHWYLCESVRFANSELMEIDRGGSDYWRATLAELQEKFK